MITAEECVAQSIGTFGRDLAISTSFQKEGMIVVHMAARINPAISVFTLDTGRLPEETYAMIEKVRERYGIAVETVSPVAEEIERMTAAHGPNLFYRDVPSRMLCCEVRKVRPLARKLAGLRAYMTGLRRGQSESRAEIEQVDSSAAPVKISPLAFWSRQEVDAYIALHDVPVHPLYARGYPSIGCAPCTRAIAPGEAERAGRWWWEGDTQKECGIHFTPDGRAQRTVDVLLSELLTRG